MKFTQESYLKPSTKQSSDIRKELLIKVPEGTEIEVLKEEEVGTHKKITCEFYVFAPHVQEENKPNVQPVAAKRLTSRHQIRANLFKPVTPNTPNFTWNEATRGGTRMPSTDEIMFNIMKVAEMLQYLRDEVFKKPIKITSWLRVPYQTGSFHYKGLAVDFVIDGVHPHTAYRTLDNLPQFKNQGLGKYNAHCHFDLRGYRARWTGTSR